MNKYAKIEEQVKKQIRESLNKRVIGWDSIDPELANFSLIERWVTDIMAIGFNDHELNKASLDIYELQKPLEGVTLAEVNLENIRGRITLSASRFPEEIEAFRRYVELRDSESDEVILFKVREEIQHIEEGEFCLIY